MSPELTVAKLDAARRQLETAIVLYFHEGDPVSTHTLAGAAHQIILDLSRTSEGAPMLHDWVLAQIKPEHVAAIRRTLREAQNFFKHAEKDGGAAQTFDTGQTEFLLLDAVWKYHELSTERLPLGSVFLVWSTATWGRDFLSYGVPIEAEVVKKISAMPRQAFFNDYLPIVHRAMAAAQHR